MTDTDEKKDISRDEQGQTAQLVTQHWEQRKGRRSTKKAILRINQTRAGCGDTHL
jgi:hypothetical protein